MLLVDGIKQNAFVGRRKKGGDSNFHLKPDQMMTNRIEMAVNGGIQKGERDETSFGVGAGCAEDVRNVNFFTILGVARQFPAEFTLPTRFILWHQHDSLINKNKLVT